jgi:hypothetical protein
VTTEISVTPLVTKIFPAAAVFEGAMAGGRSTSAYGNGAKPTLQNRPTSGNLFLEDHDLMPGQVG